MDDYNVINTMKETIIGNSKALAKLGGWGDNAADRLMMRIPEEGKTSMGADAGIYAALGMVPEEHVKFIANLHAGTYNEDVVNKLREEYRDFSTGGDGGGTAYWLLANRLCSEGDVTQEMFIEQVNNYSTLTEGFKCNDDEVVTSVREVIANEYNSMTSSFGVFDGVPFGMTDGSLHGAYLAGHPFGVVGASEFGIFFIGTYKESLGLENFEFDNKTQDVNGVELRMSGSISPQFAKVSDFHELSAAIKHVKRTLL